MSAHIDPPSSNAFARSYTLTYAMAGNLALLVAAGTGALVDAPAWLWSVSPLLAFAAVVYVFFVVRANILYFGERRSLTRWECVVSALATGGAAAVIWVVAFLLLSAAGADFA